MNGGYEYRLSTQKRKDILLNSIYGVDIDPQAVEVTKLSLLLKVLEGESQDSINAQARFFHERALPDLGRNIKCGNSLIGDDFDDSELSEAERRKINKFNWQREFPHIFPSPSGKRASSLPLPSGEGRGEGQLSQPVNIDDQNSLRIRSAFPAPASPRQGARHLRGG